MKELGIQRIYAEGKSLLVMCTCIRNEHRSNGTSIDYISSGYNIKRIGENEVRKMSGWRSNDNPFTDGDDDGNSDGEGDGDYDTFNDIKIGTDRFIFLIDCDESMFIDRKKPSATATGSLSSLSYSSRNMKDIKRNNYFTDCLKVALSVMKSKIVSEAKSSVGIIFYGTNSSIDITSNSSNTSTNNSSSNDANSGIYEFLPLEQISAVNIVKLIDLLSNISAAEGMKGNRSISSSATAITSSLNKALKRCSQAFIEKKSSTRDDKRVWIFTNDDNPNYSNTNNNINQLRILTVADDCKQQGFEFALWYMGNAFDTRKFFNKLIKADGETDEDIQMNLQKGSDVNGFDDVVEVIRRKEERKRVFANVPFYFNINDNKSTVNEANSYTYSAMSVNVCHLYAVTKKPIPVKVCRRSSVPVLRMSKKLDGETGATVSNASIQEFIIVGDTRVPFAKEDLNRIKYQSSASAAGADTASSSSTVSSSDVGISLLYFADKRVLDRVYNVEAPLFIYPDDKSVAGSAALFATLLIDIAKKDLVAVVKFKRTKTSKAVVCVLIPQLETVYADGSQDMPSGFHMITLPYLEDIRAAPDVPNDAVLCMVDDDKVAAAQAMISAYQYSDTFKYEKEISNPSLQLFYSFLQCKCLEEAAPDFNVHTDDKLIPCIDVAGTDTTTCSSSSDGKAATAREALNRFKDVLRLDVEAVKPVKKRATATAAKKEPSVKKPKKEK